MPETCFVNGCTSRGHRSGKSFYSVPAVLSNQGERTLELSTQRRREWIRAFNRKEDPTKHSRVCSDHFISGKPAKLYDTTNPDWVPSLLMSQRKRETSLSQESPSKQRKVSRYARSKKRLEVKNQQEAAKDLLDFAQASQVSMVPCAEDPLTTDTCKEVPPTLDACTFRVLGPLKTHNHEDVDADKTPTVTMYQAEMQHLLHEIDILQGKMACLELSERFFECDTKVKFYTGLSSSKVLFTVFRHVENYISVTLCGRLSKFQNFSLTLMKLRLGMPMQDLAYRFGISRSSVSRIFQSVIHVLYIRLKCLILWPEREQLQKTMPMSFRENFGIKVTTIIDRFEIFIDKPSSLEARAQTWSTYKKHNTIKYLIGIIPQGVISFISKGWGGRCSDRYVTENSGFLNNIMPGDVILANCGFNIADSVGVMSAKVMIPAFTKSKSHLHPVEVEDSRALANARVHVERLIGVVHQKYAILGGIQPIAFLQTDSANVIVPTLDKIVVVCCALVNCCPSVMSFD